ncbi:MAG: polysaccharide biosynthesis tyrosine autokinase [Desulfobulbaceae bacterium]|nr:polysaccharide biosynthesis tyrosine autokinase [Desulfobulbaceae bacterium]
MTQNFHNNDHMPPRNELALQQEQSHLPSTHVRETIPYFDESEVHLRDYIDVVLRRKWVVIITLLVVFSFVAINTLTETPLYLAKGTIMTSPKGRNITSFQEIDDSFMKSQEYIATQVSLLQSERLLSRVIDEMDLNNNPHFSGKENRQTSDGFLAGLKQTVIAFKTTVKDIIRPQSGTDLVIADNPEYSRQVVLERNLKKLKDSLQINPVKNTQLLEITFESPHAGLAADIVNTTMRQFLETTIQGRLSSFQSAEVFLDKQIEAAKIKLEKSEQELNKFARQTGILSLDSKLNLVMRQLEEFNNALSEAVTVRIAKEALYRQAAKGGESLPAVMNNELIQGLKKQYNDLQTEYQVLSATFKDEYPKIKELKAKMADIQNRYQQEQQRIIDSIRMEYESALDNEQRLISMAEKQKQLSLELNDKATQYKILEREVFSNKEVYNSLLSRSKEISASVGADAGNIEIIDTARAPLSPYKPNVRRQLLMGIMLGLFGGVGIAFLLEYMDNTIKSADEFPQRYRIPLLGLIPFCKHDPDADIDLAYRFYTDPKDRLSEAIRTTMFSIELSSSDRPPKTMLITSVLADVGKSTIACNFSLSLLGSQGKVLLIDTDLRKPSLHTIFNLKDNSKGLSTFLAGTSKIDEVIRKTPFDNLCFIPSGPIPPNPAELLATAKMRNFIATAAKEFDYIIIDTPPFQGFAEILVLSNMVDGVILVGELNKTPREGIEYFKKAVTNVGGRILGVMINKVGSSGSGYRYYGGYKYSKYSYGYGPEK